MLVIAEKKCICIRTCSTGVCFFFVGIYGTRAVFSLRFALLETKGFKGEREKIIDHF